MKAMFVKGLRCSIIYMMPVPKEYTMTRCTIFLYVLREMTLDIRKSIVQLIKIDTNRLTNPDIGETKEEFNNMVEVVFDRET